MYKTIRAPRSTERRHPFASFKTYRATSSFFLFQVSAAAPLSRAVRTYSINRSSSTAAAAVTGSSNRHSPFSISSTLSTNPTRYNPSLLTASEKKNLYGWKVKSMENKYIRKRRRKGGASMKGVKAIKREKSRPPHIFHQERERERERGRIIKW